MKLTFLLFENNSQSVRDLIDKVMNLSSIIREENEIILVLSKTDWQNLDREPPETLSEENKVAIKLNSELSGNNSESEFTVICIDDFHRDELIQELKEIIAKKTKGEELVKEVQPEKKSKAKLPNRELVSVSKLVTSNKYKGVNNDKSKKNRLSQRENRIMEMLATGMDTHNVAKELFISYKTLRKHIQNIYIKLEVNSRIGSINTWKEINKK